MHEEMNKNDCFMIVKICEIAQFIRATPGSSLVSNKAIDFNLPSGNSIPSKHKHEKMN